jgi:hypothetical protein
MANRSYSGDFFVIFVVLVSINCDTCAMRKSLEATEDNAREQLKVLKQLRERVESP